MGFDAQLTITLGVGPKAGFAAVGAGSYQYEFDIVDSVGTTIVMSGDQCETSEALSAAVAIAGNYAGIGPGTDIPTLTCTVSAPGAGPHNYDIRNMNINGNGPSSGAGFGARNGFDANINRSADPAETNPLANYVPAGHR